MSFITPQDARNYLERWALLEAAEIAALRDTPITTKARQLAALVDVRRVFGADPERDAGVEAARARWSRVRRALGD